jgi:hypothetical protein
MSPGCDVARSRPRVGDPQAANRHLGAVRRACPVLEQHGIAPRPVQPRASTPAQLGEHAYALGITLRQRKINHQDPRAARDSPGKAGQSGGRDGVPDPKRQVIPRTTRTLSSIRSTTKKSPCSRACSPGSRRITSGERSAAAPVRSWQDRGSRSPTAPTRHRAATRTARSTSPHLHLCHGVGRRPQLAEGGRRARTAAGQQSSRLVHDRNYLAWRCAGAPCWCPAWDSSPMPTTCS